jgi:hypothetical protein
MAAQKLHRQQPTQIPLRMKCLQIHPLAMKQFSVNNRLLLKIDNLSHYYIAAKKKQTQLRKT